MNYKKIYDRIVEHRKSVEYNGYTETHHIVPKCLGGSDNKDNLVKLNAKEHFICHLLLVKIYENDIHSYKKMLKAFIYMAAGNTKQQRYISSREYVKIKSDFSAYQSEMQTGNLNSQFGTMWIYNLELEQNKKIKINDNIPNGWFSGRIINFKKYKYDLKVKQQTSMDRVNKERERIEKNIILYSDMYNIYNAVGFLKMKEITNYQFTQENFVNNCKKYVDCFIPQHGKKRGR